MKTRSFARTALASLAILIVVALAARGYLGQWAVRLGEGGPKATLVSLDGIDRLRADFDAAAGSPRLVLLLSPT